MASRTPPLTPAQALYVIERLISERRVSAAIVGRLSSEMDSEIRRLEERLAALRGKANGQAPSKPSRLSAATQASRRLQGQYLNLIRRVPASQRARFKRIAQTKGREQAVKELRKSLDAAPE